MEENKFYVYRHIRLDKNVPFYIGIGTKPQKYNSFESEYKRAFSKDKRNKFWWAVVNKTDYKVEIIYECSTKEESKVKETEFINLYGRRDLFKGTLVNMTDGGDGCISISPHTRKQKSDKMKEIWQREEYKSVQTDVRKDLWKNQSYRDKMVNNSLKMWSDPEFKKMMSQKQIDRWDDESKKKWSEARKGCIVTEEHKNKIKNTKRELYGILVVDKETGIFYDSLKEACEATNYVYHIANGRQRKNSKNSRFIRVTDDKEINDNQIKSI